VKTIVVWDIMACVVVVVVTFIYEALISTDFIASNGRLIINDELERVWKAVGGPI